MKASKKTYYKETAAKFADAASVFDSKSIYSPHSRVVDSEIDKSSRSTSKHKDTNSEMALNFLGNEKLYKSKNEYDQSEAIVKMSSKLATTTKNLQRMEDRLQYFSSELKNSLLDNSRKDLLIKKLNDELSKTRDELLISQERLKLVNTTRYSSEEIIDQLQRQLKHKDEEIYKLKENLRETTSLHSELNTKYSNVIEKANHGIIEKELAIHACKQSDSDLNRLKKQFKSLIKTQDKQIQQLNADLAKIKTEKLNLESKLNDLKDEQRKQLSSLVALQSQNQINNSEMEEIKKQKFDERSLIEENKELKELLLQKETEVSLLSQSNEMTEAERKKFASRVLELKQSLGESQTKLKIAEQSKTRLSNDLENEHTKNIHLRQKNKELESSIKILSTQFSELSDTMKFTNGIVESERKAMHASKKKAESLENQLQNRDSSCKELEATIQSLKQSQISQQTEITQLTQTNISLRQEYEETAKKLKSFETSISSFQNTHTQLNNEKQNRQQLEYEIEKLQNERDSLTRSLEQSEILAKSQQQTIESLKSQNSFLLNLIRKSMKKVANIQKSVGDKFSVISKKLSDTFEDLEQRSLFISENMSKFTVNSQTSAELLGKLKALQIEKTASELRITELTREMRQEREEADEAMAQMKRLLDVHVSDDGSLADALRASVAAIETLIDDRTLNQSLATEADALAAANAQYKEERRRMSEAIESLRSALSKTKNALVASESENSRLKQEALEARLNLNSSQN